MSNLKSAIVHNQRFHKYEKMLRRIRLNIFEYEDQGKLDKAQRIIDKIKAICKPTWNKRAKRIENRMADRLWNL